VVSRCPVPDRNGCDKYLGELQPLHQAERGRGVAAQTVLAMAPAISRIDSKSGLPAYSRGGNGHGKWEEKTKDPGKTGIEMSHSIRSLGRMYITAKHGKPMIHTSTNPPIAERKRLCNRPWIHRLLPRDQEFGAAEESRKDEMSYFQPITKRPGREATDPGPSSATREQAARPGNLHASGIAIRHLEKQIRQLT
jgi:hypothetical protein